MSTKYEVLVEQKKKHVTYRFSVKHHVMGTYGAMEV
jgi:hypothetical protein